MRNNKNRKRLVYVCEASVIAALYAAITLLIAPIGSGAIQCRISEALCVLPFFTSAAIPGLTVGCLAANFLVSGLWQDLGFGTLATFLGALGAYWLRKFPYLVPLPTVLSNTVIVPLVLAYAYNVPDGLPFLMLTVGLGEIISAYVLGMLLLVTLKRYEGKIFR